MKNIKNYTFIIISICYFIAYFLFTKWYVSLDLIIWDSLYNSYIKNLDTNNIKILFSFINAIFTLSLFFYWFNIFQWKINSLVWKVTKNLTYSNFINTLFSKFINISKYIISIYLAIIVAIIPAKLQVFVDKIFSVSFLIAFLILLNSVVNSIFAELQKKEQKDSMSKHVFPIVNKFILIFIWIMWIITILSNLWYDVSALITWAWVGWLAMALAAQKTVANIFWAINVIINRPFKIWDRIKIWTNEWLVKDIWMIYLRLENDAGHDILIPNETIISATIENISKNNKK